MTMAVDLLSPRPDIVYMKRRLKPGEASQAATAVSSGGLSLDLSRPASAPEAAGGSVTPDLMQTPEYARDYTHGSAGNPIEITEHEPVARLSKFQSITGSITGNISNFGWETTDRKAGLVDRNSVFGAEMPSYGNRKLVEFYRGDFVLGLRHSRNLRRLVVASNEPILKLQTVSTTITMDTDNGNNVLFISVIDGQVEMRLEKIYNASIDEAFTFIQRG